MAQLSLVMNQPRSSQRLAWLEATRFIAAVAILLYHAQVYFTQFRYTPQPTGLWANLQALGPDLSLGWGSGVGAALALPWWFGYQFVDVFVLISGFSLVVSVGDHSLQAASFLRQRLLRLLWPLWTVAWMLYPVLWAIGAATDSYIPSAWSAFAGLTFPLVIDFRASYLQPTSGPWWFVALFLCFTLLFPLLWMLMHRWGSRSLLLVSLGVTLSYRLLAIYIFDGHPTYVILDTSSQELPFQLFLAKLSTFVLGMVMAKVFIQRRGPLFWPPAQALVIGLLFYSVGFVSQFYRLGWVWADLLLPIGLSLLCMVMLRPLTRPLAVRRIALSLGLSSYSFFLIHDAVVNRTVILIIQGSWQRYLALVPVMILTTLFLAVLADRLCPFFKRLVMRLLQDVDYALTQTLETPTLHWRPQVNDRVSYQNQTHWYVVQVEQLLDAGHHYLCKISDGGTTQWVDMDQIEPLIEIPILESH
jgi:peptidoglycan/LPS O-acetylase OafA/YrhL